MGSVLNYQLLFHVCSAIIILLWSKKALELILMKKNLFKFFIAILSSIILLTSCVNNSARQIEFSSREESSIQSESMSTVTVTQEESKSETTLPYDPVAELPADVE